MQATTTEMRWAAAKLCAARGFGAQMWRLMVQALSDDNRVDSGIIKAE